MSHIDVHEIKLNLRYPNSRQEDITDAFMRGYQGAVKIGNDAVRRVGAEKAALERRIDELCAEVEALKRDEWSAGFNAGCEAVEAAYEDGKAHYEDENAKLRELVSDMGKMLTLASWTSVENDEQASQCIYRAEALGIEVD